MITKGILKQNESQSVPETLHSLPFLRLTPFKVGIIISILQMRPREVRQVLNGFIACEEEKNTLGWFSLEPILSPVWCTVLYIIQWFYLLGKISKSLRS